MPKDWPYQPLPICHKNPEQKKRKKVTSMRMRFLDAFSPRAITPAPSFSERSVEARELALRA